MFIPNPPSRRSRGVSDKHGGVNCPEGKYCLSFHVWMSPLLAMDLESMKLKIRRFCFSDFRLSPWKRGGWNSNWTIWKAEGDYSLCTAAPHLKKIPIFLRWGAAVHRLVWSPWGRVVVELKASFLLFPVKESLSMILFNFPVPIYVLKQSI